MNGYCENAGKVPYDECPLCNPPYKCGYYPCDNLITESTAYYVTYYDTRMENPDELHVCHDCFVTVQDRMAYWSGREDVVRDVVAALEDLLGDDQYDHDVWSMLTALELRNLLPNTERRLALLRMLERTADRLHGLNRVLAY